EFDPNVIAYVQQPAPIEYLGADGNMHSYTPDARVVFQTSPDPAAPNGLLIEVKTKRWLAKHAHKQNAAWSGADKWARHNGIGFCVYDEDAIRTTLSKNRSFLFPYRGGDGASGEAMFLRKTLALGPAGIGDLLEKAAAAE